MDARIRLYIDGKEAAQDQGEVQFTKMEFPAYRYFR